MRTRLLFAIFILAAATVVLLRATIFAGKHTQVTKVGHATKESSDAPPAAADSRKVNRDTKPTPSVVPEYTGPKRAGGGPVNPEIHFPLPPPPMLTPQEELQTFKLPPGFHAEVVASEPMIEAPVAVSWDDQSRMYVCEMRGYMHDVDGTGEDQATGRISRLESTKGDGIYDKATVFVDKLVMPRAVMALGDGVLVAEPPNLVWYHDVDGDGMADRQDLVAADFGKKGGEPEGLANTPTWMMDNWISSAAYPIRFRLQGGKFAKQEDVPFGQWGLTQDDWGRRFTNSNTNLLRADLLPATYYLRNPHLASRTALAVLVMPDPTTWPSVPTPGVNRGYREDTYKDGRLIPGALRPDGTLRSVTASCGPGVYRGDLFPPEYHGNAFIPEPAGNLVKRVILTEKDAEIAAANAYEGQEFMTSTDERFRPVNTCTGPDGALYIVDMARGIIQHKAFLTYYLAKNIQDRKLDTSSNLGRIYRIVPDGTAPKLVKLPTETAQIPAMLTHANGWVRDAAQRVLIERADAAVVPEVQKIVIAGPTSQARVQALWTLEGLNALTPGVVTAALHDADEKVRVAAVRVADPALLPELVKLAGDPSREVRLHLAFKLSGHSEPAAAQALLSLLEGGSPLFGEAAASGLYGRELQYLHSLSILPIAEDARLAASKVFHVLAACVMKERIGPRVAHLLELIAAQPTGSLRQLALLEGAISAAPADKSRPLKLSAAPAGLAALGAIKEPTVKTLVKQINRQIVWPGKPGWEEPVVSPLNTGQQARFAKGKAIYSTICVTCHQPSGAGMPGIAPPLVNSEWVLGDPDRLVRIVTQGLSGPIEVDGNRFQLEMPALAIFDDEQVAAVLTYIRREWNHTAPAVEPGFVSSVRAAIGNRTKPWTVEELGQSVQANSVTAE